MMKSDNVTVYRLKEDWEPFDKGAEFTYDEDGIYMLKANDKVMAEIPVDLLEVVGNKRWKPEKKDTYYHLYSSGSIGSTMFYPGSDGDEGRLVIGNYFRTEEDALEMVKWLEARQRLIESGARFINSRDINASENCFNVYFSVNEGELMVNDVFLGKNAVFSRELYFDDKQLAERSIEEHKDDWLTYLGVKGGVSDDQD